MEKLNKELILKITIVSLLTAQVETFDIDDQVHILNDIANELLLEQQRKANE